MVGTCIKIYGNVLQLHTTYIILDKFSSFLQVSIPGLHVTLGVYLKMFNTFESFCNELDIDLEVILAQNDTSLDTSYGDFIEILKHKQQLKKDIQELVDQHESHQQEINVRIIENPDDEQQVIDQYEAIMNNLEQEMQKKNEEQESLEELNDQMPDNIGICATSLDITLNKLGVQRQAYMGRVLLEITAINYSR